MFAVAAVFEKLKKQGISSHRAQKAKVNTFFVITKLTFTINITMSLKVPGHFKITGNSPKSFRRGQKFRGGVDCCPPPLSRPC